MASKILKYDWARLQQELPTKNTKDDALKREVLFQRIDDNGSGGLSLQEITQALENDLQLADMSEARSAITRAFKSVIEKSKNKSSNVIEKGNFRLFLISLKQYFEYHQMFSAMDENGDGKIDIQEFKQAIPIMNLYGVELENPESSFLDITKKKSKKYILFNQFTEWAINKSLDFFTKDLDDYEKEEQKYKNSSAVYKKQHEENMRLEQELKRQQEERIKMELEKEAELKRQAELELQQKQEQLRLEEEERQRKEREERQARQLQEKIEQEKKNNQFKEYNEKRNQFLIDKREYELQKQKLVEQQSILLNIINSTNLQNESKNIHKMEQKQQQADDQSQNNSFFNYKALHLKNDSPFQYNHKYRHYKKSRNLTSVLGESNTISLLGGIDPSLQDVSLTQPNTPVYLAKGFTQNQKIFDKQNNYQNHSNRNGSIGNESEFCINQNNVKQQKNQSLEKEEKQLKLQEVLEDQNFKISQNEFETDNIQHKFSLMENFNFVDKYYNHQWKNHNLIRKNFFKYLEETGISIGFQIIFNEIKANQIPENQTVFQYAAQRLREIGKTQTD